MFSVPSYTADFSGTPVVHCYDPVVPLHHSAPGLSAVQRYESVPGGLAKALQVLQDRFGQPFKIVRACVDNLVKGPVIALQDKKGLQRYADRAQVMYVGSYELPRRNEHGQP